MEDFKDEQTLRQIKLFGNIEFIGELFKCHLLRGDTAKSIFEQLLKEDCFVDETVEAAIKLIEKIGASIEEKHKSEKQSKGSSKISPEEYKGILARFDQIWKASETEGDHRRVGKRI